MKKKLRLLLASITLLITAIGTVTFITQNEVIETEMTLEEQRAALAEIVANSPYKETLTWDKAKRKEAGLPPNKYFEQMWEQTVNPSKGKLDIDDLQKLRERLIQERSAQRSPGEDGNAWEERGPNNIGGRTRAILFDPNDASNNTVYAGGVSGGLWINTNIASAASSWARVENVPGNLAVSSITVDPNNSNRWWIGTGEQYTFGDVVGNGVYVTNNGGTSWNAVNIPAQGSQFTGAGDNIFVEGIFFVTDIIASNNNGDTELFVGVGATFLDTADGAPFNSLGLQTAGLYRSQDAGLTWGKIQGDDFMTTFPNGVIAPVIPNDFEIGPDNRLWMSTTGNPDSGIIGGRIYVTANGFNNAAFLTLPNSNRVEIEVSSTNPNKLYALTQGTTADAPVQIFKTTDGFATAPVAMPLPNDADPGIPANDFARRQAFYNLMIEVDPSNDDIVYVGGIDLFRSGDGANSWTQISKWKNRDGLEALNIPLVHADHHAMTFRPGNSNQAIFGTDGGVYYASTLSTASNNANAISARNNNYNITQFVKAGIGPNGPGDTEGIFSAGAQDNGTQGFRNATPGINSSEELSVGDGFYTFVDKDGEFIIHTAFNNIIYKTDLPWDGEVASFIAQDGDLIVANDTAGDFVNQMGYDNNANRLLTNFTFTNGEGTVVNSILNVNVAAETNARFDLTQLTAKPTAFTASPFTDNLWVVGLADGTFLALIGVTDNNIANIVTLTTPFVGSISSIRFGETENDIFVTIHNYGVISVWASSNGGATWTNKEGNLPNIPVRDILQNPLNRNEAILATQLGVWSTLNFNDDRPIWTQAYNGMSDVSVTSFDYWAVNGDDTNNQVIASTYGRGVFTGTFTADTAAETEPPTAPTLTASNTTETTTLLTWTASTDNVAVAEYDLFVNGNTTPFASTPNLSFTATGIPFGSTNTFTVVARDTSGNISPPSNEVSVTTVDVTAPLPITDLTASNITETTVDLTWTAPEDNIGIINYGIFQNGVFSGIIVTETNATITGLIPGSTNTFIVRAQDAAENLSPNSNEVSVTTLADTEAPTAITDLTAANITETSVDLTWTAPEDNVGVINYGIFQNGVFSGIIATETNATITGLIPGSTTTFFVRAQDAAQNLSPNSNEVSVTTNLPIDETAPTAPTNLTADNTTETTTDLTWTASIDNIGVVSYDVLQDGVVIGNTADTNFTVTGLTASTTFTITVIANDAAANQSGASNEVSVTTIDETAPTAPTDLAAANTTETTTDLTWTASTDNVGVVSYDVLRDGTVIGNTANTNFAVTGLTASTTHTFTVIANDAAGNQSDASNEISVTTDAVIVDLTYCDSASTNTNDEFISRVQLGSIDNASGAQFYSDFTNISTSLTIGSSAVITITPTWTGTIFPEGYSVWIDYNKDGDFLDSGEQAWSQAPSTDTPASGNFTVPASASNGATRMRVSMKYNAIPTSCETFTYGEVEDYTVNLEDGVIDPTDTIAPTAPVLTASNTTETTVSLTWTASTDNVGVVRYDVFRDGSYIADVPDATGLTVGGLAPATQYIFTVFARDAAGNVSPSSNEVSVTTDDVSAVTYCDSASTNTNDEFIGRVQLGNIDNSSDAQFYSDFTSISTSLSKGAEAIITVTPTWTGTVYPEGYSVWIDYNQDGDFTDSGEQVWTQLPTRRASVSGTFTVPSSALNGATRMRVSMKYFGIPTSCETFTYGEVEDYTVNIVGGSAARQQDSTVDSDSGTTTPAFEIRIYPNPVKGPSLNVRTHTDNISYKIYNLLGQLTSKGVLNTKTLDVSGLQSGVYMIEFIHGEKKITKRFVRK